MCAGAILQARIPQVIFGARDPKGGAMGGVLDLFWENFNHRPAVIAGVMEQECAELLKNFFDKKTVLTVFIVLLKKIMPVYWRNLEDE